MAAVMPTDTYAPPRAGSAPGTPSLLLADDAKGGLVASSDGGASWHIAGDPSHITAFAIDPQAPGTIDAGTWRPNIYKSTDAGVHWTAAPASQ